MFKLSFLVLNHYHCYVDILPVVAFVDAKLHWNKKSCPQKIFLPVPRYVPAFYLDAVNENFTEVFLGVIDDNLCSVAVSIDNTGSWPVAGIVPRIIRSFAGVFRENSHDTDLEFSLILFSAVTENLKFGEKIIQRILEEVYDKKENSKESEYTYQHSKAK